MTGQSNPFASRFIRPGALEYRFFNGQSIDDLVLRFCKSGVRRAAIVGPHGSGKSTLLHSLVPRLGSVEWTWDALSQSTLNPPAALTMDGLELQSQSGRGLFPCIRWFRMSSSMPNAAPLFADVSDWNEETLVIVDGYEQLGPFDRAKLWWAARRSHVGLLVTCHYPLLLYPTLMTTEVTEASAEYVVRRLLASRKDIADRLISSDRWQVIRDRWQNNLRESLFELYDLMETIHA